MKSADARALIEAITNDPRAFGKLTHWERDFVRSITAQIEKGTNWFSPRQSTKLQDVYRRVM